MKMLLMNCLKSSVADADRMQRRLEMLLVGIGLGMAGWDGDQRRDVAMEGKSLTACLF